jgi:hypothetical protein
MPSKSVSWKIVLICLVSLIIGISISWGIFDAVPHLEDEHANLYQAKIFASGKIANPDTALFSSFWVPFVVNYNGHLFSKYTPGYSLVLALGVIAHIPWLINPILAAAGLFAVFLLCKEIYDERTGVLAATLGLISPMYMLLSGTFLSHSFSITLLTFFAWAFIRMHKEEVYRPWHFAMLSGLFMGFAIITRPWTAVGVGLPFVIYALVKFIRSPKKYWKLYLVTVACCVLIALLLPLYNAITTGNPLMNTYTLIWSYDTIGFGPDHGSHGYTLEKMWRNLKTDLAEYNQFSLGWPVVQGYAIPLAWIVVLFGLLLPKREKRDWLVIIPAITLILAYMAYWARSGGIYGPRYYAETLPFFWIIVSRGLLKFDQFKINYWITRAALLVFVLWNIIMVTHPVFEKCRDLYDINRDDVRTIEQANIHHAIVFVFSDYWTKYANFSWKNPIDLAEADIIYAHDRGPENQKVIEAIPGRQIYYYNHDASPQLVQANP